jgi:hypothetical protein
VQENLRQIAYVLRHDPAIIAGFLLIGFSSLLYFRVQVKMLRAGYLTSLSFFRLDKWATPLKYFQVRETQGWSPWPVYLLLPGLIAGVALLVIGLCRL